MAAELDRGGWGRRTALSLPPRAVSRRRGGLGDRVFARWSWPRCGWSCCWPAAWSRRSCWESWAAIRAFGWRFLVTSHWDPVAGEFGALPFIYGTLVSSLLALLIAVPLSLGAAIFLAELAPAWIRPPIAFLIEMLAAIPSVVYGLWGIFVLVPWLRDWVQPALGRTPRLPAALPGAALRRRDARGGHDPGDHDRAVHHLGEPRGAARGARAPSARPRSALGATRWETTRIAVLRYGRSGLVGAILLGLGRALGETMAVTMVIGNRPEIARLAVRARLHHGERDRQRVHRGHVRPLRVGAGRDRPAAARGHRRSSTGWPGSWCGAWAARPAGLRE